MLPNTILIILLLTFMVQSVNAAGTVVIELGGPNDPCYKYTAKGTDYLALTHVRIIETPRKPKNGVFEIVNNIACHLKSQDGPYKYIFDCPGKQSGRTDTGEFTIVGVKPIKPMLSGSIEYQYDEELVKMFEMGFLDPAKMKNEKFHHDRHLHIKSVNPQRVTHSNSTYYMTDCYKHFPRRLIADHGLYMMVGSSGFMVPIYYEPYVKDGVLDTRDTNH